MRAPTMRIRALTMRIRALVNRTRLELPLARPERRLGLRVLQHAATPPHATYGTPHRAAARKTAPRTTRHAVCSNTATARCGGLLSARLCRTSAHSTAPLCTCHATAKRARPAQMWPQCAPCGPPPPALSESSAAADRAMLDGRSACCCAALRWPYARTADRTRGAAEPTFSFSSVLKFSSASSRCRTVSRPCPTQCRGGARGGDAPFAIPTALDAPLLFIARRGRHRCNL